MPKLITIISEKWDKFLKDGGFVGPVPAEPIMEAEAEEIKAPTFNKAFGIARKKGLKTFSYKAQGKKAIIASTRLKGESEAQHAAALKKVQAPKQQAPAKKPQQNVSSGGLVYGKSKQQLQKQKSTGTPDSKPAKNQKPPQPPTAKAKTAKKDYKFSEDLLQKFHKAEFALWDRMKLDRSKQKDREKFNNSSYRKEFNAYVKRHNTGKSLERLRMADPDKYLKGIIAITQKYLTRPNKIGTQGERYSRRKTMYSLRGVKFNKKTVKEAGKINAAHLPGASQAKVLSIKTAKGEISLFVPIRKPTNNTYLPIYNRQGIGVGWWNTVAKSFEDAFKGFLERKKDWPKPLDRVFAMKTAQRQGKKG